MVEKDGRISCFKKLLEKNGSIVQKGRRVYRYTQVVSERQINTALGIL